MIVVPEDFAKTRIKEAGQAGRLWIEELPRIVEGLCDRWRLIPEEPLMHGHLGLVIPVRRDAELVVLKVSWADDSNAHEAKALAAWNGKGAVRLLEHDLDSDAML